MRYVLTNLFYIIMHVQLVHAMDTAMVAIDQPIESGEEHLNRINNEFIEILDTLFYCPIRKMQRSKIVGNAATITNLKSLLKQGAHVGTLNFDNRTSLIEVCDKLPSSFENNLQYQLIELLLTFRANPGYRDAFGKSAIEYAAARNNPAAIQQLVNAGASVCGTSHITPCHFACYHDATKALGLLLSQGASCNDIDYSGRAPIHYALEKGWRTEELSLLLEHGANLDTQFEGKRTSDPTIKIDIHPNPPFSSLVRGSSPFHQSAQLYRHFRKNCDIFVRVPTAHIKKLLLYHALFYGTTDVQSMFTFLCCIRRLSAPLYGLCNSLLIPRFKLQPHLVRSMHSSNNYDIRKIAAQALIYRTQKLQLILNLCDVNGNTAHDIELLYCPDFEEDVEQVKEHPDLKIEATKVLNPKSLVLDCEAFCQAIPTGTLESLSETNPYKAAWSLMPTESESQPLPEPTGQAAQTPVKDSNEKCVVC